MKEQKDIENSEGYKEFCQEIENQTRGCKTSLIKKGLPITGWFEDRAGIKERSICEVCGHNPIKYIHYMKHPDLTETYRVGRVCAAIMSGDKYRIYDSYNRLKNMESEIKRTESKLKHFYEKKDERRNDFYSNLTKKWKINKKKRYAEYQIERGLRLLFSHLHENRKNYSVSICKRVNSKYTVVQSINILNGLPLTTIGNLKYAGFEIMEDYIESQLRLKLQHLKGYLERFL